MISNEEMPEILRLDDLERKGLRHLARGRRDGCERTIRRATQLLDATHLRGIAVVTDMPPYRIVA